MVIVRILSLSYLLCIGLWMNPHSLCGDEYVIDGETNETQVIGNFTCSNCLSPSRSSLELIRIGGEVTAGDIWQFYHGQGIDSLEHLPICLDVKTGSRDRAADISSLRLTIQAPEAKERFLTDASLGENSLTIPDYEIVGFKPEAYLELELGYDFMKRFTADSQERVSVDVATKNGSQLSVMVIGHPSLFTTNLEPISLGLFALFWVLVFLGLHTLTQPGNKRSHSINLMSRLPSRRQKVSPQ